MPSVILGNVSGGMNILSGSFWSGVVRQGNPSLTGAQLRLHPNASGNAYVGLSGGVTAMSGPIRDSGFTSGLMDGMLMTPGDSYFIPKLGMGVSGLPQIFIATDAAASGQARMFYELF
jgi:hypothetical protein